MDLTLALLSNFRLYFQRDFKFKSFVYLIVIVAYMWHS